MNWRCSPPVTMKPPMPADVLKLLDALPEKQRLPIRLMKLEGLSVVEAARMAGMSESAVKVGVHRGLKALAKMIGGAP